MIPATKNLEADKSQIQRVAAYCRVSTLEEAQAGSFELQLQHYREMIENKPEWELVGIYADEGVSGTSLKKRVNFMRMIEDCNEGKIDLIVTKSVSRFARNTLDCVKIVRNLKALNPPVGVFFEMEGLNTAESKNEFLLIVLSVVAQGESEQKSAAILWSYYDRFSKGIPIFSTHNLLGYDKNHFGEVIIAAEEAEVVKYIYACYMDGQNAREIADALTAAHIPTVKGNERWSPSVILNMLRNEKYCGNSLMQKSYTVDCFTHKRVKNTGQKPKFFKSGSHPAIIPPEEWELVQEQLLHRRNALKGKNKPIEKNFLLTRIKGGKLKGFILIDPKWKSKELEQFFKKLNLK
jgi:site-specific DNA recombinase